MSLQQPWISICTRVLHYAKFKDDYLCHMWLLTLPVLKIIAFVMHVIYYGLKKYLPWLIIDAPSELHIDTEIQ